MRPKSARDPTMMFLTKILAVMMMLTGDAHADLMIENDLFLGSGTTKSTFTATPGNITPALSLSSGIAIAEGGIEYPDGSVQYTSKFQVNITTHQVPTSTTTVTGTIAGSTITINVTDGSLVRVTYACDGSTAPTPRSVLVYRNNQLFGGQEGGSVGIAGLSLEMTDDPVTPFSGVLYDNPPAGGATYYLNIGSQSSTFALEQVCVFSLEELPQ